MRAHVILLLSLAASLVGTQDSSAQSFKDKLKKATREVGQQVSR